VRTPYEKVTRFIARESMLDGATGVVVAVSGGPDSVVLLDMLARFTGETGRWGSEHVGGSDADCPSPILTLHVAHLDHMLRGRESADDAQFARALADGMGLAVTINAIDIRAASEDGRRGIEETAREIRYRFLLRVAEETGCNRIAVGHTMTDQAETFLMRLIRGSGSRGLAAMRPVSAVPTGRGSEGATGRGSEVAQSPRLPVSPSPLLIRPLLCITREEVEAYCCERNLEFRTDVTNQDSHYTRNRIRSDIIPALTAINPRVVESIARAAENLASDQDAMDSFSLSLVDKARIRRAHDAAHDNDGSAAYSVMALLKQPAGMRRRMIIEALRIARDARVPDLAAGEVSSTHIRAVEALLNQAAGGKRITLAGGLEVWREFDALVFKDSAIEPAEYQIAISACDVEAEAEGFDFTLQRDLPGSLLGSVIQTTQSEKERTGLDWMAVALTDCALPDYLIIRPRHSGERAHVVGQRRTKKLKNLMIDHRIPSSRRVNWPLVTTPDGRYVWSPGLPPAIEFAARDESQRLAILRASVI
jgi:tRNA(Ile)-lysidine synthetase-like protein